MFVRLGALEGRTAETSSVRRVCPSSGVALTTFGDFFTPPRERDPATPSGLLRIQRERPRFLEALGVFVDDDYFGALMEIFSLRSLRENCACSSILPPSSSLPLKFTENFTGTPSSVSQIAMSAVSISAALPY